MADYASVAPGVSINRRRHRLGRGHRGGDAGRRADRLLGRLHVRPAGRAESTDHQYPARHLGADGELQPPRPEWRRAEARRRRRSPAFTPARSPQWDAAPIAALNPGVTLPHQPIVPIRRADASGDTFIFTQFLDFSTQSWEDKIGYGTSVAWPAVADERTGTGNDGMVAAAAATPYSVAYIGISFRDATAKAGLGDALLGNQSGKFVLPTAETVSTAASALDPRTPPDERLSLVFAPGDDSYPLVNYEYTVVSSRQPDPRTAAALRQFLLWAISREGGNAPKYLDAVGFIPLPDFIRALSENQIALIK